VTSASWCSRTTPATLARSSGETFQAAQPSALRTIAKKAKAAAVANLALVDAVVETLEDAEDIRDALVVRARIARGHEAAPIRRTGC
jgi:anti-sigma factor RsiW